MVKAKSFLEKSYVTIIFIFLYLPIAVLIALSFNASKSKASWGGFTLDWYKNLFNNSNIMDALANTLSIALISALFAALIGTAAAIGINAMRRRNYNLLMGATNIPLLNADIVTGISLMLLFVRFMDLGYNTILLAHITFNIPYVILSVMPKLYSVNKSAYEAALDLGASPFLAFRKTVWPDIFPGVLTGFLMALTMSLDDFAITYFTKGVGINTISTMIYAELRRGIKPEIYALSTLLFVTVLALLLIVNYRSAKNYKHKKERI